MVNDRHIMPGRRDHRHIDATGFTNVRDLRLGSRWSPNRQSGETLSRLTNLMPIGGRTAQAIGFTNG